MTAAVSELAPVTPGSQDAAPAARASPVRSALVVDDSRAQRKILVISLTRLGYRVFEAPSAVKALRMPVLHEVDFVLCGWMMPGMSGPEFCRAFRALPRTTYGYLILLTSKSAKSEVAQGLDAGADDFLGKPVDAEELRARLAAGERILRMERELTEKNRVIGAALDKIRGLYNAIDRDLIQARKVQESLVPQRVLRFGKSRVSMLLEPSGRVGGDLVGAFSAGRNHVAFYSIDVSGHGVSSALMTARLAGYLSGQYPEQNIALEHRSGGDFALRPPQVVAAILNERLLSDHGVEDYFTMVYAIADLASRVVHMVQAGHPNPLMQHNDGRVKYLGRPGLPIGLIPGARYEATEVTLQQGERLLLYSDGFTESRRKDGEMLDEDGLAALVTRNSGLRGIEMLDDTFRRLNGSRPGASLEDDVSAVLFEYEGPED